MILLDLRSVPLCLRPPREDIFFVYCLLKDETLRETNKSVYEFIISKAEVTQEIEISLFF